MGGHGQQAPGKGERKAGAHVTKGSPHRPACSKVPQSSTKEKVRRYSQARCRAVHMLLAHLTTPCRLGCWDAQLGIQQRCLRCTRPHALVLLLHVEGCDLPFCLCQCDTWKHSHTHMVLISRKRTSCCFGASVGVLPCNGLSSGSPFVAALYNLPREQHAGWHQLEAMQAGSSKASSSM